MKATIEQVSAFVGDVDGTDTVERFKARVTELGLFCCVYTTHNLMLQIWYDYTLYFDFSLYGIPTEALEKMSFFGQMFGEVNGDILSMTNEAWLETSTLGEIAEFSINSKQRFGLKRLAKVGGERPLETVDILEGQAFCNELFVALVAHASAQEVSTLLERATTNSTYIRRSRSR